MGAQVGQRTDENTGPGYSSLTRRERLERIASAERDRRAGRKEVAVATIGEPVEWPARAVLALASLSEADQVSRRLLEEGLDEWARNAGLGQLNPPAPDPGPRADTADQAEEVEQAEQRLEEQEALETTTNDSDASEELDPLGFDLTTHPLSPELEAPLGLEELDRAFDEAEADVDSMHSVNEVAERVLMDEPIGFAALAGNDLTPVDDREEFDVVSPPDIFETDAAYVAPSSAYEKLKRGFEVGPPTESVSRTAFHSKTDLAPDVVSDLTSGGRQQVILETLESWLQNLENRKLNSRKAGRA